MDTLRVGAAKIKASPKAVKRKIDEKLNRDSKYRSYPNVFSFFSISFLLEIGLYFFLYKKQII